jgi:arginase
MVKTVGLIGVPASMGAVAPGQEKAPRAWREAGLVERLPQAGVEVVDYGDSALRRWFPDPSRRAAQHASVVAEVAAETAQRVARAFGERQTPVVLGGDCTIELGTVAGFLQSNHRVGLIYFDLHPDLNVPDVVPDGALDWMGLAHLISEEGALADLQLAGSTAPMLRSDAVVLLGYGPEHSTSFERGVIDRRGIPAIPVDIVATMPERAAAYALAAFPRQVDHVLVHFDVDIIDFTDLPLSEERVRNQGLTFAQAMRVLGVLAADERFAALTVAEVNPDHGAEDGSTIETLAAGLANALSGDAVAKIGGARGVDA